MNARQAVFSALLRMYKEKSYSTLTLDSVLRENDLSPRDKTFASALFYGILERKLTLDYVILKLTGRRIKKLDAEVLAALEMGLYQLKYMESVPDSAAVNESVAVIKKSGKKSASGFVNGVLRSFIRSEKVVPLPDEKDKHHRAEVEYSISRWILKRWENDYGWEFAVDMAKASLGRPELTLRVNTIKTTAAEAKALLEKDGVVVTETSLPDCLTIEHSGAVTSLQAYKQGLVYVQDASSQLCAHALGAKLGERVFDMCAAPGSKSFTIAQLMENRGELYSFDLYEKRVGLIAKGAKRLGIEIISAKTGDSSKFDETLGMADRILCDVPCSGLGVIRRKPEIKYKTEEEVESLPPLQREILSNAARYLKPGGILVYSTCALDKLENEENVRWFLNEHPEFTLAPLPECFGGFPEAESGMVTLSPLAGPFDGFFIARLMRKTK